MRVANPQSWGRGGRRGSGIVPFERALVTSYRLSNLHSNFSSIFTRSEILALLFSSTPLFSGSEFSRLAHLVWFLPVYGDTAAVQSR